MQTEKNTTTSGSDRIELAKKCLTLISNIAQRGASSEDPEQIGCALQELTQVLFERTGNHERLFEPIPANEIQDLDYLCSELDFVESCSTSIAAGATNGTLA
jgi:hypothetical protein